MFDIRSFGTFTYQISWRSSRICSWNDFKSFDRFQPSQHIGSIQWPCAWCTVLVRASQPWRSAILSASTRYFSKMLWLNCLKIKSDKKRSSQVPVATKLHCVFLVLPFRAPDLLRLPPLQLGATNSHLPSPTPSFRGDKSRSGHQKLPCSHLYNFQLTRKSRKSSRQSRRLMQFLFQVRFKAF